MKITTSTFACAPQGFRRLEVQLGRHTIYVTWSLPRITKESK